MWSPRVGLRRLVRCSCESKSLERSYWKPETQIQRTEFEQLVRPILGDRYSIELGINEKQKVILRLNVNNPKDNQSNQYDEEKRAIFDLLNDWGVASMVHTQIVKKLISYVDHKEIILPLEIDTSIEKINIEIE